MINARHIKGFTLIELIIVIVIIGILAAISGPMVKNMKKKAILTEALVVMGTIRTAERAYKVEYGAGSLGSFIDLGIKSGELEGTYVSQRCYFISHYAPYGYDEGRWRIECWLWSAVNTTAPRRDETNALFGDPWTLICLYDDGTFTQMGFPESGYPPGP